MWNRFGFLRHGCRFEESVDKGAVDTSEKTENAEYTKVQKEIADLTEDQNSENDEVNINWLLNKSFADYLWKNENVAKTLFDQVNGLITKEKVSGYSASQGNKEILEWREEIVKSLEELKTFLQPYVNQVKIDNFWESLNEGSWKLYGNKKGEQYKDKFKKIWEGDGEDVANQGAGWNGSSIDQDKWQEEKNQININRAKEIVGKNISTLISELSDSQNEKSGKNLESLKNIEKVLAHPSKENVKKLQNFIASNLSGAELTQFEKDNKKDGDEYDWYLGWSTLYHLNQVLTKFEQHFNDIKESKNIQKKHDEVKDKKNNTPETKERQPSKNFDSIQGFSSKVFENNGDVVAGYQELVKDQGQLLYFKNEYIWEKKDGWFFIKIGDKEYDVIHESDNTEINSDNGVIVKKETINSSRYGDVYNYDKYTIQLWKFENGKLTRWTEIINSDWKISQRNILTEELQSSVKWEYEDGKLDGKWRIELWEWEKRMTNEELDALTKDDVVAILEEAKKMYAETWRKPTVSGRYNLNRVIYLAKTKFNDENNEDIKIENVDYSEIHETVSNALDLRYWLRSDPSEKIKDENNITKWEKIQNKLDEIIKDLKKVN